MSWDHVSSKLGKIQPETREIARELYDAAKDAGHDIWFMWGMGTSSEHRTGLALDLMVRNKAAGDWIRNYIWSNRARLRLRHVIWWQAITSTVVRPGVVRQMSDRGNVTANHKDHIHVWFFSGKYQAPAGRPSQTTTSSSTQSLVDRVQKAVKVRVDGKWGPITDRSVMLMRNAARSRVGWPTKTNASIDIRTVQDIVGTPVDGIWGPKSQASMVKWVKNFQKVLNVKSDGLWGPKTDGKLLLVRRRHLNRF